MGPLGVLTGEPLAFAPAARVGAALDRLERDAGMAFPLRHAEWAAAALTRERFLLLLEPPRGDQALAVALARCVRRDGEENVAAMRPVPGARSRTLRSERDALVRASGSESQRGTAGRVLPAPAPAALVRGRAGDARPERVVEPAAAVRRQEVSEHEPVAAPRGFEHVAAMRGLESFAERMPGGTYAVRAPLPSIETAAAVSPAPTSVPRERTVSSPIEPGPLVRPPRPPAAAEAVLEPPFGPRLAHASAHADARALDRESGLAALVRAWVDSDTAPTGAAIPAAGDSPGSDPIAGTSASERGAPVAAATRSPIANPRPAARLHEDELTGDTLGRVLVSELRRYGIEVEVG
jgi:hypothetical protein